MTDTLLAPAEQHDVEFGLLFGSRGGGGFSSAPRGGPHRRGGHAELLFDGLDQAFQFHDGHTVPGRSASVIECHLSYLLRSSDSVNGMEDVAGQAAAALGRGNFATAL